MSRIDIYDPFLPWLELNPDHDRKDQRREFQDAMIRDELTRGYLEGRTDLETLLDCLAQQGIDPQTWLDETIGQMERIVDSGITFASNETGLFLPVH